MNALSSGEVTELVVWHVNLRDYHNTRLANGLETHQGAWRIAAQTVKALEELRTLRAMLDDAALALGADLPSAPDDDAAPRSGRDILANMINQGDD